MRTRLFEPIGDGQRRVRSAWLAGAGGPAVGPCRDGWGKSSLSRQTTHHRSARRAIVHVTIPDWAKFALLHLRGDRGEAPLPRAGHLPGAPHPARTARNYAAGWGVDHPRWAGGSRP